ncbi:MAG: sensor histidine kinase [Proteobacteria bacterium]|nr:sensor histidine kinase [Pseudomonadota bacterium]
MTKSKWRLSILASSLIIITLLHNIVHFEGPLSLNIYQRLYYIPIVMAAYWFGLKGALITSIISTFSYPHHGHYSWPDKPFYTMNQYAEMLMFNLIAIVTGILSDLETRQRRKYEKTSEELKEAYQKLQDSFAQMRKVDRLSALGELSAAMAHEIRNPLGSIKGGIEIIEEGFDKNSRKYEFVDIIKKEIARLDRIISEFLTYARPRPPHKSMNSINEIINSVVALLGREADRQGVKVSLGLSADIPEIMMDGEQVKQAILNVLLNAMQAIEVDGAVTVNTCMKDAMLQVSVRDTGKGISEKEAEKLFDPFFTTKEKGTGLGLSISYQIIKAHSGDIEVVRPEGGGSEFIISIPADDGELEYEK